MTSTATMRAIQFGRPTLNKDGRTTAPRRRSRIPRRVPAHRKRRRNCRDQPPTMRAPRRVALNLALFSGQRARKGRIEFVGTLPNQMLVDA